MYAINTANQTPENFFAGEYPIVTAVGEVATGKTVKKFEAVKLVNGKIEPIVKIAASVADSANVVPAKTEAENTTENLYGIAADVANAGEQVVVYLTGEYYANAIELATGVTLDTLTQAFRKLGIFLK